MKFEKYHGLGNDFIIITYQDNIDYKSLAIRICDRNTGVGADGLIILKEEPYEMIFYNKDGSISSMCGNGIRCLAHYINNNYDNTLDFIDIKTKSSNIKIELLNKNPFISKVLMPKHTFDISEYSDYLTIYKHKHVINNITFEITSLVLGTIHTVLFIDSNTNIDYDVIGSKLANLSLFKNQSNINFVNVIDQDNIRLLTYERGVGLTDACGTGATASVYVANLFDLVNKDVLVHTKRGSIKIEISEDIYMIGESNFVFKGEYK